MLVHYMKKTWVKTSVALVLTSLLGWFVVSRGIMDSHSMFHQGSNDAIDWLTVDLFQASIGQESCQIAKNSVKITTQVKKIMDLDIFVRQCLPPSEVPASGHTILLLHGQHYTSKNWEELGTLALMAALGHTVVAIDLPGYGRSSEDHFTGDRAQFLKSAVEELSEGAPVIVSPSMSGTFSLPFIENFPSLMLGYVPVAPAGSSHVNTSILEKIMVPTVILNGEYDTTGLDKESLKVLLHLPNSCQVLLKQAKHAAYLDQPELFHKMLYNFLLLLPRSS